jgi:glucokinase-like ROK family protein
MGRPILPKGSPQYINKLNKIKILNLIRDKGRISRAEAAKESEISAPTVTRIVDSLIQEGMVMEIGSGVSSGGRRPTLLEFAGMDNFVIGIDLGTTHIYGVLANLNAEIIKEVKCDTIIEEGFAKIMERTLDIICELREHPHVKGKKIFGIGMAVAGLINRWKNIVEYSPDFHWKDADIIDMLGKRCELPLIFDNVTRVMALGELWYGIGTRIKNFIVINIGYGIGSGIIINGKPLYGTKGMAGEFGHITLEKESRLRCECGNYGCLEALASGHAIALNAQRALKKDNKSLLFKMSNGDPSQITSKMVADAAEKGDPLAASIFKKAAEYIGIGTAGLINLFNPEAIVIGGGVAQAGDLLFDTIKTVIRKRSMTTISRDIIILPVKFGMNAAVMGSVALILNEVLHLNFQSYESEKEKNLQVMGVI